MLRTLRSRLILSHMLPLVIITPLVGLVLVYVLETRVVLPNLARQLSGQAILVAELTHAQPAVWQNEAAAASFVARTSRLFPGQLMLLSPGGAVLASSDPADAAAIGHPLQMAGLQEALAGQPYSEIHYGQGEAADVLVAATMPDGRVAGVVRITDYFGNVFDGFLRLRFLIAEVLIAGLVIGAGLGLALAVTIERPIEELTKVVQRLAGGSQFVHLHERGPEETRLLVRAFNVLLERLARLEEMRRQSLANLVHELGRPLGALRAANHALLTGALDDRELARELLTGVGGELERLERLLDDLAELHDQLVGELELHRRPLALDEWLPPVLATWGEAARQKGLDWQVGIGSELAPVEADRDRLAQAVGNLLSNAVKYTPPGGRVCVEAGDDGATAWLQITDTGPGIAPEEQERVFDAFYRNPQGRRFPQGMGLGLTIARDLVLAHGGQLELQSSPGHGSCFTIRLPHSSQG